MSIVVSPPVPLPIATVEWRLIEPAQVNRSEWTGRRKVIGLPGAPRWTAKIELVPFVSEANVRRWRGWLAALQGPVNRFPVVACESQQTTASNPSVRAGAGNGRTLPLTGLPASATVLPAGAFLTVPLPSGHYRLVCLTAALTSDASGNATASFAPDLGEVPPYGTVVEIQKPYALMALTDDPAGWSVGRGQIYAITLNCEEAL